MIPETIVSVGKQTAILEAGRPTRKTKAAMSAIIRLALLSLLLAPCVCQASPVTYPHQPGAWSPVAPPTLGSDDLQRANRSLCQWRVSMQGGKPIVTLEPMEQTSRSKNRSVSAFKIGKESGYFGKQITRRVDDGWLVGFNAGEFGASLWWFSPDAARRYKVSDDQVNEFVNMPAGLVAVQGLAHLTLSYGSVVRLTKTAQGRWRSTVLATLGDEPCAAALDTDGTLVVIGASKLMRVWPTGKVEVLWSKSAAKELYPASIVRVASGKFYVGMRAYVVRFTISGRGTKVQWLLPSQMFLRTGPMDSL